MINDYSTSDKKNLTKIMKKETDKKNLNKEKGIPSEE